MVKQRLSGQERREKILEAALDVFAREGFSGARTKEIARAAGVSETLVFQHFGSKEKLYHQALGHLFRGHPILPDIEDHLSGGDDRGFLVGLAGHIIEHGRRDPRIVRLAVFSGLEGRGMDHLQEHGHPEGLPQAELTAYIQRRMDDGAFRPGEARVAAKLFLYMVFQMVADHHLHLTGDPLELSDEMAAQAVVDLFLGGMKK